MSPTHVTEMIEEGQLLLDEARRAGIIVKFRTRAKGKEPKFVLHGRLGSLYLIMRLMDRAEAVTAALEQGSKL